MPHAADVASKTSAAPSCDGGFKVYPKMQGTVVGSVSTDHDYDGRTVDGNDDVGNMADFDVEGMDTTAESSFTDRCNVPKGQCSVYAAGLKLSKHMLPSI